MRSSGSGPTEEQRAAQAKYAAAQSARQDLATEIERVQAEHAKVVDELDRMRGTLFDHDSLLDEYSRKLRDEQEAQARAHGEQVRAEEALRVAERNLEVAMESGRRRAEDDAARFDKVEADWRQACLERDRAQAELRQITTGDGELARLRVEIEAAREDQARLMGELDVQAARADKAETELTVAARLADRGREDGGRRDAGARAGDHRTRDDAGRAGREDRGARRRTIDVASHDRRAHREAVDIHEHGRERHRARRRPRDATRRRGRRP